MRCSTRPWRAALVLGLCLCAGPVLRAEAGGMEVAGEEELAEEPELAEAAEEAELVEDQGDEKEALERVREGALDSDTLAETLPLLADPQQREFLRSKILGIAEPPRIALVALLDHPVLATRMGALELLEELAGTDYDFNPWLAGGSPENEGSRARWQAWTGEKAREETGASPEHGLFSDEQRRSYLLDLLGEDADKAARARRMLETEGLPAVGFLENYLASSPALPPGARARVREAQYQIVLSPRLGSQSAETARYLVFGSRDQLLGALAVVRGCGREALPVLRDFITHADPLVRETAIDSLLATGGESAVEIVAPLLAKEPDVNVIHGALRRLKEIKSEASERLVAGFLTHPDEDLLVSAIQTCLSLSGDTDSDSWSGGDTSKARPDQDAAILHCLEDSRWRIRAAALEYVGRRRPAAAKKQVLALLKDPDPFVRSAAVRAAVGLRAKEVLVSLREMLLADPATAPLVLEGYTGLKAKLDAEMLAKLDAAPPEVRLSLIGPRLPQDLLVRYAGDPNDDLACAALRVLAQDSDSVKNAAAAGALLAALRGSNQARLAAALERLRLPRPVKGERQPDPVLAQLAEGIQETARSTALDPLYEAFLLPGTGHRAEREDAGAPATPTGSLAEILTELERHTTPETPPELRLSAIFNLVRQARPVGVAALARDLPQLDTAARIAACEAMDGPSSKEVFLDILKTLLRDPSPEVRKEAAECALSSDKASALVRMLLDELSRPGARLQAPEVMSYRFGSTARGEAMMRDWAGSVLEDAEAPVPLRVLALVAIREARAPRLLELVRAQTESDEVYVRRAAWRALLQLRTSELAKNAGTIAADPEAFVREVLPHVTTGARGDWTVRFSDSESTGDSSYSFLYNNETSQVPEGVRAHLADMALRDPAPRLRFEAALALITMGVPPPDFSEFVALAARQPEEAQVAYRIGEWLDDNASRATPALRPLMDLADGRHIRPANLAILRRKMAIEEDSGFPTFASLVSADASAVDPSQPLLEPAGEEEQAAPRESLLLVFFQKPGCAECARVRRWIDDLRQDFPRLKLEEHNILAQDSIVLNQALCDRLNVPSNFHNVTPAVFAQGGWLAKDFTIQALADLLAKTSGLPEDNGWRGTDQARLIEAAAAVERRYEALTLPAVLMAGLLDGVSPCAFATIIFFLSYLRIARRTPREMLMVGAAFVSAVFLAYFAAGLVLYQALEWLHSRFGGLRVWLNWGFAVLALLAALLSFRDALRARAGRLDEMTLQLPGAIKGHIRKVVRGGARARRFVIAAFVSGVAISFLELACTGQVYAPIIYQIQRGHLDAVTWLFLYNLAFITPLVVIFALAYAGLRAETLVSFQKTHTFAVKLALGLLFLALALFILLGDRLLRL